MTRTSTPMYCAIQRFIAWQWKVLAIICIPSGYMHAQRPHAVSSEIMFATGKYTIEHIALFQTQHQALSRHEAARRLFRSFEATSLVEYCNYFTPGACHVDTTTFETWKTQLGDVRPNITASIQLSSANRQYVVIKYTLSRDHLIHSAAQLFMKWQDEWYFCPLDENVANADLIMFFTLASDSFLQALKKRDFGMVNSTCPDIQQPLDGGALINRYFDKYRSQSPCHDVLNSIFQDRIRSVSTHAASAYPAYISYFRSVALPADELEYLSRLVAAHQTQAAIDHFSKLTGNSPEEIQSGIQKAYHDEK